MKRRGRFRAATRPPPQRRSTPIIRSIVVADFISFATTFSFLKTSSLIHSVAPPLKIRPASLGSDFVFVEDVEREPLILVLSVPICYSVFRRKEGCAWRKSECRQPKN